MALFGKKKGNGEADDAGDVATSDETPVDPSPKKAARFFEYARTVHEAQNYEYAMQNWLQGLAFDPTDMSALEGFFESANGFRSDSKGKLSKDTKNAIGSKNAAERWAQALLAWGVKPTDLSLAVRAVKLGAKCELPEQVYWMGEKALSLAAGDKKAKKETYLELMKALNSVGAFDLGVRAGEMAVRMDPNDGALAAEVRDMSAKAAMNRGGFDSQEEGGFRKNLRNADAQRQLEEDARIVKSGGVKDRAIADAEEALKSRPDDLPTIDKLLRALRERGTDEDERRAQKIAMKVYESTKQFKYRQMAGEVRLRRARRRLGEYRRVAEAKPNDAAVQEKFKKAQKQFTEMEAEELELRVEAYPTDLSLKFELAVRLARLGGAENQERAIGLFQEAKNDGKLKAKSLMHLGYSFAAIGWADEAIEQLRAALDAHDDDSNEDGMGLRYALMDSLETKARSDKDIESATEAEKLAAGIAMQQLGFRDIRERRQALKELIKELGG